MHRQRATGGNQFAIGKSYSRGEIAGEIRFDNAISTEYSVSGVRGCLGKKGFNNIVPSIFTSGPLSSPELVLRPLLFRAGGHEDFSAENEVVLHAEGSRRDWHSWGIAP